MHISYTYSVLLYLAYAQKHKHIAHCSLKRLVDIHTYRTSHAVTMTRRPLAGFISNNAATVSIDSSHPLVPSPYVLLHDNRKIVENLLKSCTTKSNASNKWYHFTYFPATNRYNRIQRPYICNPMHANVTPSRRSLSI
jgi:hypothetical protein